MIKEIYKIGLERRSILTVLVIMVPFFLLGFQSPAENVVINRLEVPIEFDGKPTQEEWSTIPKTGLTQLAPNNGISSTEDADVRLCYDDDYFYVAAFCYDKTPSKILANSKKRDEFGLSNDWIGVIFDSYNDNENALSFFTTPLGLRTDFTIFEDAIGGFPVNLSWNTFWDVKTSRDENGWYAEMRIPLSSLQFQEIDGKVTMGIIVWRYIAHANEESTWPPIKLEFGEWSGFKPSQAQDVTLTGVKSKRPVYITPYVLAGAEQVNDLNSDETAYDLNTKERIEAGVDIKYNLTSNLTLDLSVNTDFAQVEADDQQINLSRFSLFFPEKRQFFQERASIFELRIGGPNRLFYSRRIGLADGEPIRILGGARITGRVGDYDVGLINMQTGKRDSINSENFTVLRGRKKVINEFSYVGAILTNRMDFKGNYNTVYGGDLDYRMFGNDYLKIRLAQSLDNGKKNNPLSIDQSLLFINWWRIQYEGFAYDISYSYSGGEFNPAMGFQFRSNFMSSFFILSYGWIMPESSLLTRHKISSFNFTYLNNDRLLNETTNNNISWDVETKKGFYFSTGLSYGFERLFEDFELADDVTIAPGGYTNPSYSFRFSTPSNKKLFTGFNVGISEYFGGRRLEFGIGPTWNIAPGIELSGVYEYNTIDFSALNQKLETHIARVKLQYLFSTKFSTSAFVQYVSTIDKVIGNFRLRYNPKEGNDLYLVYNENWNSDRPGDDPLLPVTDRRTIILKYTYTFRL